jgi:hypothetical protein
MSDKEIICLLDSEEYCTARSYDRRACKLEGVSKFASCKYSFVAIQLPEVAAKLEESPVPVIQQPQPKIITPHCGEGSGCVFPERVNCVGCEYSL